MKAADKLKAAGVTPFEATVQEGWRGFIWFEELMIRTDPEAYKGLHDGSVPYDGARRAEGLPALVGHVRQGLLHRPALQ